MCLMQVTLRETEREKEAISVMEVLLHVYRLKHEGLLICFYTSNIPLSTCVCVKTYIKI